jgi:hypothetical protein
MADAGGAHLNTSAQLEKRGRGRPRGSKNKSKDPSTVALSSVSMKRRPGCPVGSKNKPKVSAAAPGPSAAPHHASPPPPPKIYSFFCIAGAQCREIQWVPQILEEELPMKWRYGTMDAVRCTSGVVGPSLRKIMTSTKGFS